MSADPRARAFASRLDRARRAGRALVDLAESDPSRCGLGPGLSLVATRGSAAGPQALGDAREAIAAHLCGRGAPSAPDRVLLAPSAAAAYGWLLELLCPGDGEMLVPSPCSPIPALAPARAARYALRYDGAWRIDRASLLRALTPRTRAVLVASPSSPAGALLSGDELAFLDELCAERGLALVGDEGLAETALAPTASVLGATRCGAFQVSSIATLLGAPFEEGWLALAGEPSIVRSFVARLEAIARPAPSQEAAAMLSALLARREPFLSALRKRLTDNRVCLATGALAEAPFTLLNGGGGWWAVLQIGDADDEGAVAGALLDAGVVVQPGFLFGFERSGYLVVSLLPRPEIFREGVERLSKVLRSPIA